MSSPNCPATSDLGLRSDQDRPDQVGLSRLDRSRQRGLVARVRDRRGHRLELGAGLDQRG